MFRFTKENIEKVLSLNEGMETETHYEGKNGDNDNYYKVENGKLLWRRYKDSDWQELDYETTQRFLRNHKNRFIMP